MGHWWVERYSSSAEIPVTMCTWLRVTGSSFGWGADCRGNTFYTFSVHYNWNAALAAMAIYLMPSSCCAVRWRTSVHITDWGCEDIKKPYEILELMAHTTKKSGISGCHGKFSGPGTVTEYRFATGSASKQALTVRARYLSYNEILNTPSSGTLRVAMIAIHIGTEVLIND